MKRAKKWIPVVLSLTFLSTFAINVEAKENLGTEETILKEGIYMDEELPALADALGYETVTEDGYTLESIAISFEKDDSASTPTPEFNDGDMPSICAIGDYIGNVKKAKSDIYFSNSPIASNWYDGPLSKVSKTYSRTVSAVYSCTASVSADVLNAGLSFSVTDSTTESTTLERPAVSSTQRINIKEFGVYDKYTFTLYNIFGTEKGTGSAYKPMGLYVAQAIYSK